MFDEDVTNYDDPVCTNEDLPPFFDYEEYLYDENGNYLREVIA